MYKELDLPGFAHARRYASVTSTMDVARALLSEHHPNHSEWSAVVFADVQTAGRGRQGRVWLASDGSLMVTYILATALPLAALAGYSLAAGVAVAEVLEGCGIQTSLKWPNDIVVLHGAKALRKLGGILIEVQEVADFQCIIVGLGLNIAPAPSEVSDIAVSVHELGGVGLSAEKLVAPLGAALRAWHQKFVSGGGFKEIRSAWSDRACFQAGRSQVTADLGEGRLLTGIFAGIDDNGAMLLEVSGKCHTVISGHISSFLLNPESF